jgi:hypothetical protein
MPLFVEEEDKPVESVRVGARQLHLDVVDPHFRKLRHRGAAASVRNRRRKHRLYEYETCTIGRPFTVDCIVLRRQYVAATVFAQAYAGMKARKISGVGNKTKNK